MTRTVDHRLRANLLDGIVDYILSNGIADLSLRPLARAVDASPRGLLYHFSSKEELIVEVLARLRERQQKMFAALRSESEKPPAAMCRHAWSFLSDKKYRSAYQLLFEIYSRALREPKRYRNFIRGAVDDWIGFLGESVRREGGSKEQADSYATMVLAGFRGFLMDLCATGARKRVDRAVNLWIDALESVAVHWRP